MTYKNKELKEYSPHKDNFFHPNLGGFPNDLTLTQVNELEDGSTEYLELNFSSNDQSEGDNRVTIQRIQGFRGVK